jgi:hypothetical protein
MDGIKNTSRLEQFGIHKFQIEEFQSAELQQLKSTYRHISCFNEKFERFVLERWFVTEIIRKCAPNNIYLMLDSDVAVFGNINALLQNLPDCPISMGGDNPHFTFIKESISDFLQFILKVYADPGKLSASRELHLRMKGGSKIYNLGEMEFLDLYMKQSTEMQNYEQNTSAGYVDSNIHKTEGFDSLHLRRRQRKIVVWQQENRLNIPYFKRGDRLVRAFLLHFQGPGKRVFFRFNGGRLFNSQLGLLILNNIFQSRSISNVL